MGNVFEDALKARQGQPVDQSTDQSVTIPAPVVSPALDQRTATPSQDQPQSGMVGDTPITMHGVSQDQVNAATVPPSSGGNLIEQVAKERESAEKISGAGGSWGEEPTRVGQMPRLDEVWEGVSSPLIPEARQGSLADTMKKFAESDPTEFSLNHPKVAGALKGLAGSIYDTMETLRGFTSPLAIGTFGLGELAEGSGAGAKLAKAGSRAVEAGFGAQGMKDAYDGVQEGDVHKTLNGLGQALLSVAAEMKGTKLGNANIIPGEKVPGQKTVLRPTSKTVAGVEAPIAAIQQEDPSLLTKVMSHATTPGQATEFQEKYTKPAARRQAISTLSQVATDKIAAHDALANGEEAPASISGTQTPGEHLLPQEMWPAMQDSAGRTFQKARDISSREVADWNEKRRVAEESQKASIDHYNDLVANHNADPANINDQMEPHQFDPHDANLPERPKAYDELKAELDAAKDRTDKFNPTDVREKAKIVDVPKAEKALDSWFKDHEDIVSPAEYESAKELWADSEKFKQIDLSLSKKLATGSLSGADIRGLESLIDNKAKRIRGQAGIGEFNRLMGPEAVENLNTVAKLFDPLEKTDPRTGVMKSWGSYVAKHVVTTMMAQIFGMHYLALEGVSVLHELFMNHVLFDPEFGRSFTNMVQATKDAFSAGTKVPAALVNNFKDKLTGIVERYKQSRLGGEEGAVGARVKKANVGPRAGKTPLAANVTPNASGESSASQEAINRESSEKSQGLKRVVVDTRSGIERPLIGVTAVDYQAKPYESVEFRGGDRDGEVIDQGAKARPYQRKDNVFTRAAAERNNRSTVNVAASANEYNQAAGRPAIEHEALNPDVRREDIADAFDEMKHDPNNPKVKASYAALKKEIKAQWDFATKKMGIKIEPTDNDPYGFSGSGKPAEDELFDDVNQNKHLGVWRGGNPLEEGHPLAEVDKDTGENYNTMLRAVHDLFGHVAAGNRFGEAGEESAWNLHKQMFSKEAMPAMTTETRGQTSWFFNNKGVREGGVPGQFAVQKAGLLPEFANERTSKQVLDHIKSDKPFAVLTAENPQNTRLPDAENQKLNNRLLARLRQEGFHPVEVEGHNQDVTGQKEHSFFVPDMDAGTAARIGREFKQTAILTQEGLHDLNKDTVNPSMNAKILTGKDAEKQPYYSSVDGTPFSVPLDFNKEVAPKPPQMVGTAEGATADTAALRQAQQELAEGKITRDQLLGRAQELKEGTRDLTASEITTRRPKSVNADTGNNPGQNSNWDAIEQADRDKPSGKTALGKKRMGYKEKLARTVSQYPGLEIDPKDMKTMSSDQVLSKFVNHVAGNLEWLYNQVPPEIRDRTHQWYDAAHNVVKSKAQSYGYSLEQGAGVTAALSPQNPWDNNLGLADRMMDIYRNRQNFPYSPEMEKMAAELKKVATQSKAFKGLLRDINGKTLKDVTNPNPDVQAVQRALWVRLYDEAHGNPTNDQYAPTGEVVGHSPDTNSWIGLDHLSKAVKILENGSVNNINDVMGQGHKIRNFYNNLVNPNSKGGHVTIDTHAVAAGLLLPIGAKDLEAAHNFGGTLKGTPGAPKNSATGLQGTYPLYAEAYQRVARKLGILPRELQSVTWEAAKALMGDEKKTPELKSRVRDIWHEVAEGALTPEEARDRIKSATNGFSKPAWMSDEEWEKLGPESEDTSFNPEENFAEAQ